MSRLIERAYKSVVSHRIRFRRCYYDSAHHWTLRNERYKIYFIVVSYQ